MAGMQSMVTLLREARGWTQTELAERATMSQAVISKVETGAIELDPERLQRLAEALDCRPESLEHNAALPSIEITCLHRRRASTMSVSTMKRIEAVTHLSRISVEGLLDGIELAPARTLERIEVLPGRGPAEVARELRYRWNVPSGPIANLIGLVESAGVVVVFRSFGTTGQDAVSTWPQDSQRPPMMLVNADLSADRLRFTVAHELGHLAMHALPVDSQEAEANIFAGEFLAPAGEIREKLEGLTTSDFRRLMALKTQWGMSMAALIRRAHDLETISDRQYREFQVRLGKLGWRTSEPGDVARENPSVVDKIIALQRSEHDYSDDDLARLAGMTEAAFRRHYLAAPEFAATRPPLRLALDE
ncbi:helix-turn-helix domain-containing protein [Homoserinibacter sp. YIM 151385]|uniref:helix-turn-helix domain-containing protein n=1 Tax=Homoserinibacter sp. YIM 151385 TaxID=2985506 RepID=UPI0022F05705|nr:XRE family transcriptional regulator [Homoserinibacter sp. YIM 151385]WBU37357.1 XRE family transcriptional regulator [Homoserinibacter sp. YIM 151385]